MEIELVRYIRVFRKWGWLILLAAFLAGSVSYLTRSGQPSSYQAQAMVSIGGFIESPNPSSSEIRTGVELAQTYAVLARTYDVLEAAVEAQNFPVTPEELGRLLTVETVSNTSLLIIRVTYTDRILVADMANEIARQIIANSPSNLTPEQLNQIALANAEIARLNTTLQTSREQLDALDVALAEAPSQADIDRLTNQRNTLLQQINLASSTLAQFTETVASLQQRSNSLDIVEQARIPTSPSGSSPLNVALLGAIVGAMLAGGVVLLVEYLDDRVHSAEEATRTLALPVLGSIPRFGKHKATYTDRLITMQDPSSSVAERYRALRTNLLFSSGERVKPIYVITSPGPEEGKSVTTANLAVVMAAAGLRVLLVDADLRRPRVHEFFGLKNEVGLSTLLFADPLDNVTADGKSLNLAANLRQCLQETHVPRLRVITSGFSPANPAEILGSALMQRWAKVFTTASNVDVVMFDSPPCLVVSDSSALAATVNASVVLVLDAGKTRRNAAIRARQQFSNLKIELQGVVINNVKPGDRDDSYYGYGGYYYYQDTPVRPNGERGLRRLLSRDSHPHVEPVEPRPDGQPRRD